MASTWSSIGKALGRLARDKGPQLVQQLQKSGVLDKAVGALTGSAAPVPKPIPGRPVTSHSAPTAQRARTISYSPDLDGRADPGEIVWTWVAYEDDPRQGKDRPVLVVGRDGDILLGLMLSSQSRRDGDRDWHAVGSGAWDSEGRPSWIRLDRVLEVPEAGIRREGAVMERRTFDSVAIRLRQDFSWR
ncbi:MAG: type II toxin-antitoxin system PemK/MazF family toxin [Rhodococcus sp. (in: high G+C Gram-positive bacteria)]|uniref:type II toxin-antitoxin system PemK/MazF family toxin n=1 Tax=Rhodococcus sp. TaxID=1831 RepID=UPI003BAEF654